MLNIGSSDLILGENFHIVITKQFGKIWENIYYKFGKNFKKMENLAKFLKSQIWGKDFFKKN
jgi:hypothetical protein